MKNDEIIEEVINTVTGPKNIIRAIASILLSEYFIPPIIYALILALIVRFVFNYPFNLHYVYMGLLVIIAGIISNFFSFFEFSLPIDIKIKKEKSKKFASHDPINFLNRLGIDLFELMVGEKLKETARNFDEDEASDSLCTEVVNEFGYIIPTIKVCGHLDLEPYEYMIFVRGNVVASGYVYPDKYMVLASEWDSYHDEIPENAIVGVEPVWQVQAYWVDKETAKKNKECVAVTPTDVIKTHLQEIAIKYANDLITIVDVGRYIEQAKTINKGIIPTLEKLNKRLSIEDIRQVFANLIMEEVSVRDICYIFERLADYARKSAEPDILSERIREDLKVQISAKNANADNVLYAINLSKEWEKTLEEHLERTALGYVLIMESEQISEFVETVATQLMLADQSVGCQPVILCAPKNRLPIYKMLKRHIPTVVVMSYLEVADNVKVEKVATIGEDSDNRPD